MEPMFPKPGKRSKKKIKKIPKIKDQMKKTTLIFNEYVRVRDCIGSTGSPEYGRCVTCRNIFFNEDGKLHAGHFIKSTHLGTRFDPVNVNLQCKKCNSFEGGNDAEYSKFIIEKYGYVKFEYLLAQKFFIKRFTAEELINIQIEYSERLNILLYAFPDYIRKSPNPSKINV